MIPTLLAGVLAGSIHVLVGPDHLAAVAPFAVRERGAAWRQGAKWGLGHTVGVAAVAVLALAFRELIPVERISGISEQLVGVVLVAVGFWTVRTGLQNRLHMHAHEHDGERHAHMHVHGSEDAHESESAHGHRHAPLWIGVLHGGAGSSHILGILPALALPTQAGSISYLAGYGAGTMVAMIGFAATLGAVSLRAGKSSGSLYRTVLLSTGGAAMVVGAIWLIP